MPHDGYSVSGQTNGLVVGQLIDLSRPCTVPSPMGTGAVAKVCTESVSRRSVSFFMAGSRGGGMDADTDRGNLLPSPHRRNRRGMNGPRGGTNAAVTAA